MTDLSWFWAIVDRDGLADLPSDEREALSRLIMRLDAMTVARDDCAARCNELLATQRAMREALRFYATAWRSPDYEMEPNASLLLDCGDKARAALAQEPSHD